MSSLTRVGTAELYYSRGQILRGERVQFFIFPADQSLFSWSILGLATRPSWCLVCWKWRSPRTRTEKQLQRQYSLTSSTHFPSRPPREGRQREVIDCPSVHRSTHISSGDQTKETEDIRKKREKTSRRVDSRFFMPYDLPRSAGI